MKIVFLLGLLVIVANAQMDYQYQNDYQNKLVLFSICEFCNGIVSHSCCKANGRCCPEYGQCRENLVCSERNKCEASSCETGCCSFGNGECCAFTAATIIFAPMLGVVKTTNTTQAPLPEN